MKKISLNIIILLAIHSFIVFGVFGAELRAYRVSADLTKADKTQEIWKPMPKVTIALTAQPMVSPRPAETSTPEIKVQAVHNGDWLAIHLNWKDPEKNEGQRVGTFSDGVAVQFPLLSNKNPPPIFMGSTEQPVQIFHWRAMYQIDKKGFHSMRDIYPNMVQDGYPQDWGKRRTRKSALELKKLTEQQSVAWSAGRAGGNPHSYRKPNGVDVILAEGFGSSSVSSDFEADADGKWENGEWNVVITRPLSKKKGEHLKPGSKTFVAFAIWRGDKQEAGSRKSITFNWTPLTISN